LELEKIQKRIFRINLISALEILFLEIPLITLVVVQAESIGEGYNMINLFAIST